ncbi:sulfatase [Salinibaculum rarum]|uniref:sulfatase family protein n=1 Tax=Salinibaculum rarum TaxID=3058903 RepID=UPI00265DF1A4|nr:sulfatase-like hydrolase/transferase [Salinibaculum sp. KK48]
MSRPNIVLLVLDAVRSDHVSAYGHDRPTTPNIDKLAEEGTRYRNAFANSNWTGTSHGTIFTGRLPSNSGIHGDHQELPDGEKTLPEAVKEEGYRTFAMSAGAHIRKERGYDRGVDAFKETYRIDPSRKFAARLFTDPPLRRQTAFTATRGPDDKTLYKFETLKRWIAANEEPFFAFINAKTAHHPYNPPRPSKSRFCPDLERPRFQLTEELFGDEFGERQTLPGTDFERLQRLSYQYPIISDELNPTDEEWEIIQSWYDGAIHYLDRRVGEFVDWLRNRGQLEETYVIVTADHGEYFGEHGLEKHYYGLYEPVLRVPLIVRGPESDDGQDIRSMVSLADLYPTIVELASGEAPKPPHSRSLAPFEDAPDHDHVFAELGAVNPSGILRHHPEFDDSGYGIPTQVVRDDRYKLHARTDDSIELYDWKSDPDETKDLSETYPNVVERLRSAINEELGTLSEAALSEDIKDDRLREHLQDLGYI